MNNVYVIVLSLGSFLSGIDPAWVALIGTLFGGVGLKSLEWWLSRNKVKLEAQQALDRDYRAEIKDLRERLAHQENREDEWREKYYDLREEMLNAVLEVKRGSDQSKDVVE